jgi:Neuraminidase (sialidase)
VDNVILTASVGDDSATDQSISLAFSDDNGVTWSQEFEIPLTDVSTQTLQWPALGSFAAPGRVFRITDYSGPIRIDGADAVLSVNGVQQGQDEDR